MFRKCLSLGLCYLLLIQTTWAQSSHTLNSNQQELKILKASGASDKAGYRQKKLEKSQNEFSFGNQMGDFSFNHLMFLTHYLPGAAIPVLCRNPLAAVATGGIGNFLPIIHLDNLMFALGSMTSLYMELLIFDHLQGFYKKLEKNMKEGAAEDDAKTTESRQRSAATNPKEQQLKALQIQYDALAHEVELLTMKAEAVRATKTMWMLSAALSVALGVVSTAAELTAYYSGTALGATAGAAIGAAAGAAIGVWIYGVGSAVGGPYGAAYGAAIGSYAGPALGLAMVEFIHNGTIDTCAPLYHITGPYLAGIGINEAIKNYNGKAEPTPPPPFEAPPAPSEEPTSMLPAHHHQQIMKVVNRAQSFDDLLFGMVESQHGRTLEPHEYLAIRQRLQKEFPQAVHSADLQALKKFLTLGLQENLWKKSHELMQKLQPIASAHAGTADDQAEAADTEAEVMEAGQLTDNFNIVKDVGSLFNTGTNVINLTNDTELGDDVKKAIKNPMAHGTEVISKYLTWEFFVKFANYLGFSNGGELAFLLYITVMGDIVTLKARSLLKHPLVPYFYRIDGTWEAKLVSSIVAAHFANGHRKEILEAKKKTIGYKIQVSQMIDKMNESVETPGSKTKGVAKGNSGTARKGVGALGSDQDKLNNCIDNSGLLGPNSINTCQQGTNKNAADFNLSNDDSDKAFGEIGEVGTGATSLSAQALSRLSIGDTKGASTNFRALSKLGPQLAATIKEKLDFLKSKYPDKNIQGQIDNIEKLFANRIQNSFTTAKDKAGNLSPIAMTFASTTPLANPILEKVTKEQNLGKDKTTFTMPTANPFGSSNSKATNQMSGELSNYTEKDYQESLKGSYDYKNDDINADTHGDLFKGITIRYFKSAYPRLMKKNQ